MAPTLLLLVGPPAVGKMAVGHEIAERTGFRLFHNHLTIEPVLRFFDFGTPPFQRLVDSFRTGVLEEVAASDLPGLVFTFVWAFDHPEDHRAVERYAAPFTSRGGAVHYVELQATQEERLRRNEGEFRLAEKPSKRDVAASRQNLLHLDSRYRLNTTGEFDDRPDYLRLDTTDLTAGRAAERIIAHFGLENGVSQVQPFRAAVEAGDINAAIALLAEDVVFHSPIAFKPYRGRDAVGMVLRAVFEVFEDFRYVREIGAPDAVDHALVFRTRIGEREIEGCDFLHLDEGGAITELTVMVRPLNGALALAEAMKAKLAGS